MQAYKVEMTTGEITLHAWAAPDGTVLREETPLGYTLVYEEGEE